MIRKMLKELDNTLRLHTAAMEKSKIYVYSGEDKIGEGYVEFITDDILKMVNGDRYMRSACKFYMNR